MKGMKKEIEKIEGEVTPYQHQPIIQGDVGDSSLTDSGVYRLVEDFEVAFRLYDESYKVAVPAGFLFDGGSVPKFLIPFFYSPYDPNVLVVALIHDWLYTSHRVSGGQCIVRKFADDVQYIFATHVGIPRKKRKLIYKGIRKKGSAYFHNSQKHDCVLCEVDRYKEGLDETQRNYYGIPDFCCDHNCIFRKIFETEDQP